MTASRLAHLLLLAAVATAAEYVADPAVATGGAGSKDSPWPGLETCIGEGRLAKLQPGDTLWLLAGNHGAAAISGKNADFITIAGVPGQDVRLSRLSIDGARWRVKGLRLSPTFGKPYKGAIVEFGDRGESGEIVLDGCEIFAVDDHAGLDVKAWMELNSGVLMGRNANGSRVRDCYIRNTRFALSMSPVGGIAEGNIIENYSADGIRMTRDDQVAEWNVIKGAFASMEEGDPNHDDAIQCFLHNKGTGTMRNLTVRWNILQGLAPGSQPHAANNQGIGFFDGPLVNFRVEGNVVMVAHWHGVSLFDAQGCTIVDNVAYTTYGGKLQPWVMLGQKLKQAKDNTVTGNYACSFKLDQPGTKAERNEPVTEDIYRKALADLSAKLCERYGQYHRASKRHRLTGVRVEKLPEEAKPAVAAKAEAPRPASLQAKEGEVERHLGLLRQRLDARLAAKGEARYRASTLDAEAIVTGRDGDQYEIEVPKTGSRMTLAIFKRLPPGDAASLAVGLAGGDDDPAGNALAAFLLLAAGEQTAAQNHLLRAGAQRQAVEAAFAAR